MSLPLYLAWCTEFIWKSPESTDLLEFRLVALQRKPDSALATATAVPQSQDFEQMSFSTGVCGMYFGLA
jgi:hypothetical protein